MKRRKPGMASHLRPLLAVLIAQLLLAPYVPNVLGASPHAADSAPQYSGVLKSAATSRVDIGAQLQSQASSAWSPVGPFGIKSNPGVFNWDKGPDAGRVNAIAIDPNSPSTIYIGAAGGGVWKSTDGGTTWKPLTDSMPDLAVSVITIGPTGAVYAGTGDSDGSFGGGLAKNGDGVYVSNDGGSTWTVLGAGTFGAATVSGVLVNPSNPSEIMVSTGIGSCCKYKSFDKNDNVGIFLSTNGGNSWSQLLSSADVLTGISEMATVPVKTSSGTQTWLYAGDFVSDIWAFYMPNYPSWSGGFWQPFPQGDLQACTAAVRSCRITLSSSPAAPDWLYAAAGAANGQLDAMGAINVVSGVVDLFNNPQNTTNTANPYGPETLPPCGLGQSFYDLAIAADPSNGNRVYFGCSELLRSDNAGGSWIDLGGYTNNSPVHPDVHAIVVGPDGTLYVGDDGGIYKSSDHGGSWTSLNAGLQITQFYSVAVDPSGEILGASQDNGCEASFDGGSSWQIINTGDGAWTGTARVNSNALMCEYPFAQFEMSLDRGRTNMHTLTSGIPGGIQQTANFITPMAQDPNSPGTLYVGADGFYKTTDYGGSWQRAGGTLANTTITAIAVSPADDAYVYAGSEQGAAFMSRDGGATWQALFKASSDVTQSVAVDDANASIAVFALAGGEKPVLIVTMNGKPQVVPVSGLPGSAIDAVRFVQGVMLVGLDEGGVYYSADLGNTWAQLGRGLPNAQVTDIAVGAGMVVVGTFGRGAWSIRVPLLTKVSITVGFSVRGGGQGYTSPVLTYFSDGAWRSAQPAPTPTAYSVDYGGIWNFSSPVLQGSSSTERWATQSAPADIYPTGSYNVSVTYQHQYHANFTYQVAGGGAGYSPPSVEYTSFGQSTSGKVGSVAWVDAGTSVQYQSILPGSGKDERWFTSASPAVSSPGSVPSTYTHQFHVTTSAEQGGSASPPTGWYNATASITLSASSAQGWRFANWAGTGTGSYSGPGASRTVILSGPISEDAVFDAGLTVKMGSGGSVEYSYGTFKGSLSGGNGTVYVPVQTTVLLAANPSFFYQFNGWSGPVVASSSLTQASIAVDSPVAIGADFALSLAPVAAVGAGVVAMLGIMLYLLRRRRAAGFPVPPPPPPPPPAGRVLAPRTHFGKLLSERVGRWFRQGPTGWTE